MGIRLSDSISLCVFCGSRAGTRASYREAALALGKAMARHGVRLVYGGGRVGLMGIVADAVRDSGGHATGVIPRFLMEREVGHDGLDEFIVTGSMHARKLRMFELSDAFIALPGGLGTLDEMIEIVTWRQLGHHEKPVCLLDVDGYWSSFRTVVERAIEEGFASPSCRDLIEFHDNPDHLVAACTARLSRR